MARYDYFCEANQRVVEVTHSIKDEALETWGQVCERSGADLGNTPANTPVRRLVTGGAGFIMKGGGQEGPAAWNEAASGHSCGSACACAGGGSFDN